LVNEIRGINSSFKCREAASDPAQYTTSSVWSEDVHVAEPGHAAVVDAARSRSVACLFCLKVGADQVLNQPGNFNSPLK
jgi:hypothetical protein